MRMIYSVRDGGKGTKGRCDRTTDARTSEPISRYDPRNPMLEELIGEELSSVMVAQNEEFTRVLHKVDEMSKTLASDHPDLRSLSDTLRSAVSCATKQMVLDQELRSLALMDDLTGLNNRRGFVLLASQQLKVARRSGHDLLLCFADVDNLKHINDAFGHKEGDLALILASEALKRTFRGSDILARMGGDEFAVLALEASSHSPQRMLRRLDQNLAELNARESRYKLSVSIGVSRLNAASDASLGELMAEADRAMYQEKEKACVRR